MQHRSDASGAPLHEPALDHAPDAAGIVSDTTPTLFPIFVDLRGRTVLLVGAGRVGVRKARELLAFGPRLRIVSPRFHPDFSAPEFASADTAAPGHPPIERIERGYQPGDEAGCRIVFAATDDSALNAAIADRCRAAGILCNAVDDPPHCDFHSAAVARRSPTCLAVSTGGAAPALASFLRRRLEEWLDDGPASLVRLVARMREEARPRLAPAARERLWKDVDYEELLDLLRRAGEAVCERHLRTLVEGAVAAQEAADQAARSAPSRAGAASLPGKVILVGAGPGHPDLITRMGLKALGRATALVYDRLVARELLEAVPTSCEKHAVGKRGFGKSVRQDEINALLVRLARAGHTVVRLKGGDPFVFGRGGEEIEALAAQGISVEVVPGLSSSLTVPTYAGIPITHRGLSRSFAIITGHTAEGAQAEIPDAETVIVMMPLHSMGPLRQRFYEAGWDPATPCAAIQSGTTPGQRLVLSRLDAFDEDMEREGIGSPVIVVVGKVVSWALQHPEAGARFTTAPRGELAD